MKAELKQAWVEALRSGEYLQCREALKRAGTGYCCLGVLVDVAQKRGELIGKWKDHPTLTEGIRVDFQLESDEHLCGTVVLEGELNGWTMERLGLKQEHHGDLIELNDSKHYTFPQIADWIEENIR